LFEYFLVLLFVLVLVIVTKISLYILFYALVYNDHDEDDAGVSSGGGTNLKVGGTCQARSARKKLLSCPSTFLLYKYNQSFW